MPLGSPRGEVVLVSCLCRSNDMGNWRIGRRRQGNPDEKRSQRLSEAAAIFKCPAFSSDCSILNGERQKWRCERDSNPRIMVLQTIPLDHLGIAPRLESAERILPKFYEGFRSRFPRLSAQGELRHQIAQNIAQDGIRIRAHARGKPDKFLYPRLVGVDCRETPLR